MRTTIDLPADLHEVLKSLAAHGGKSISQAAVALMRQGLTAPPGPSPSLSRDPVTGLTVVRVGRTLTPADVAALDDPT